MAATTDSRPSGPVFVDHSGRRHRAVRRVSAVVALLALAAGGLLTVLALVGARIDAPGLPFLRHSPHAAVGRPPSRPASEPADAVVPASGVTGSLEPTVRSSATTPTAVTPSATAVPSAVSTHTTRSSQVARASTAPALGATSTPAAKPTSRPSATTRGASTSAPGVLLRRSHP